MKLLSFFILVSAITTLAANSYSQQTKFNISFRSATVREVLQKIEDSSEFIFLYSEKSVDVDRKVDVNVTNQTVDVVLDQLFNGTRNFYEIRNRQISILEKGSTENSYFKIETESSQQHKSISGKVTDSSGIPLPGVSIVIKGTSNGVITDVNGNYTISNVPSDATIIFSFIGMGKQEIAIKGKANVNVTMVEEAVGIDEVVAIGYGSVKKSDLTGSVASVSRKDLGERQSTSIGTLLQGKVAGVDVTAGTIRVRGVTTFNATDPLVIVDGFLGGSFGNVNPNDIESIEVLKDASSTAIYGSRGANGVILVTTKKGKVGALRLNVQALQTFSTTPKKLDVLNASQYIDYVTDALTNAKMTITPKLQSADVRVDRTNWQDEVFRTGKNSTFNIDLSGGTEKSTFFVGMGYINDKSFVIGPSSHQMFLRLKNDFKVKSWLRAGDNVTLRYMILKGSTPADMSQQTPLTSTGTTSMITMAPYLPVTDPNNFWGYSRVDKNTDLSSSLNPVGLVALTRPNTNSMGFETNFWAEIEPIRELVYRVQAGVTGGFSRYKRWDDSFVNATGVTIPADYYETSSYNINPLIESYLTYTRKFGNHDLTVMAGNTWQNYAQQGGIGIYGKGYDSDQVQNVLVATTSKVLSDDFSKYAYLSYFGRLNYQFRNRYLATVNFRRDGSPRFAPSHRWGNFPSVALSWKMHEEDFIKRLVIFDQLKLRGSWGISGNDAIGAYRYLSQVWKNGVFYPLGTTPALVPGATVSADASQSIRWESTTTKSVGLDMAFLKNSLTVTAEYYVKNTDNILFAVPRASSLGYGLIDAGNATINAASCVNHGFELQAGYKNRIGLLNYSINANYSYVKNEVTSLGLGQPYLSEVSRTDVGHPIGYFYGYVADGIFSTQAQLDAANKSARDAALARNPALTPADLAKIYYQLSTTSAGDVRFKDLNGDGIVSGDKDRTMIGNSIPKHQYGFSTNLEYKGFSLDLYFQGVAGVDLYDGGYTVTRGMSAVANQETYVLDRWRSESNPGNGIVPRAVIGDPAQNNRASSLQIFNGSYLKLRQVTFSYAIPKELTSRWGLSDASVFVNGVNLLTFTKYTGFEPEIGGGNLNRGVEYLTYPTPRQVTLGIKLGL